MFFIFTFYVFILLQNRYPVGLQFRAKNHFLLGAPLCKSFLERENASPVVHYRKNCNGKQVILFPIDALRRIRSIILPTSVICLLTGYSIVMDSDTALRINWAIRSGTCTNVMECLIFFHCSCILEPFAKA